MTKTFIANDIKAIKIIRTFAKNANFHKVN